jgi:hypothetical protein
MKRRKTMARKWLLLLCLLLLLLPLAQGCKGKGKGSKPALKESASQEQVAEEDSSPRGEEQASSGSKAFSNAPPQIGSAKIVPDPAYAATDLSVEVESKDPENDLVSYAYQWMKAKEGGQVEEGEEIKGETSSTLSHENFARGDALAVVVTPFDGRSQGQPFRTKYLVVANSPPKIVSQPPDSITDRKLYRYQVKAEDPDGDSVSFSLAQGAPEGMSVDPSTGLITWPITDQSVGTYDITISADDGHQGVASQHYTLSLSYEQVKEGQK